MKRVPIADVIKKLGKPRQNTSNLVRLTLPYPMKLAWDLKTTVRSFLVHPIIREPLFNVFKKTLDHYGLKEIQKLGLDLFGGCYNYRAERGGTNFSRHSWAIAIDIDPSRNQLKSRRNKALLDNPEYDKFRQFMREEGFVSLGELSDYDWMHFEAGPKILN
jgi:hypothetical protein